MDSLCSCNPSYVKLLIDFSCRWRVKLRQEGTEGTVPSCYLEKKSTVTPPASPQIDAKTQAVISRRE